MLSMGGAAIILLLLLLLFTWDVRGRGLAVKCILLIMVATCGGCWCQGQGCHDEERRALLEIKASINNIKNGTALSDWGRLTTEGEDCCRWSGITCSNGTGHVVDIDLLELSTVEIYGTSKPVFRKEDIWYPNFTSFVQFRDLEGLDLSRNGIAGTLPDVLCELKRLKYLNLRWNSLEGPIPHCLCNMSSLTSLDLSYNHLDGRIPSCLGNLHNLEGLRLGSNEFEGSIPPDVLCELKRLKQLDLHGNSLEDPIPHCLCNMSSLTSLDLSYNHLGGRIPSCLGNLHNLEELYLSNNEFEGSIPPSIFPNLTKLIYFTVGGDRLEGTLPFSVFANISNLKEIEIYSSPGLEIETESPSWVPSFQLEILGIDSCMVNRRSGGRLPSFISSTQTRLSYLRLADVSMTGTTPLWLLCNSTLLDLSLPGNKLHGTFRLPCRNASHNIQYIDLSHNLVHGSLPSDVGFSFPNLKVLNLARNELSGSIPSSLGQAPLIALDLSHNDFSGKLPEALTRNHTTLEYLNASNNQLEGEMLRTDPFMPRLQFLFLHHNRFTGSIPPKISNSSLLMALDIGHNDLTCSLSQCLPTFPSMIYLSLRENRLQGHLPNHLCQMHHLHLLDLFGNNLSGKIPPCLNNISLWRRTSYKGTYPERWIEFAADIIQFTSKTLLNAYQGDPLAYMTGLDISSNKLDGPIPLEMGELRGLHSLNLSNNYLQGSLLASIGNMESLESLDLSHNNLSGTISQELLRLHFLSTFIVAFNNLSGLIPYNPQFSTFPKSSYEGNPALCGAPLERNCSSNTNTGQTPTVHPKEVDESSSILDNTLLFLSCVALSFVLGFWGFIATLIFNKWRIKYFRAVDRFLDYYLRRF